MLSSLERASATVAGLLALLVASADLLSAGETSTGGWWTPAATPSILSLTPQQRLYAGLAAVALGVVALVCAWRREAAARALAEQRREELAFELMATRNNFMHTDASVAAGRAGSFTPKATDVFITTYPKCGTTWMTQICHMLRTNCDMDFGEITEVVPWDILALDCGQRLDAPQVASPRLFKSHEQWEHIAKGGRYIYVARDPLDAFVSFHKFLPAYTGLQPGDISHEQFAAAIFAGASKAGGIWGHYLGWWAQRRAPNVLWVFFEDLRANLPAEVARVARFLQLPADEALLDSVVAMSSFEFMSDRRNASHFDDHFVRSHVLPKMGMSADRPYVSKVRKGGGKVGTRTEVPASVRKLLDDKWRDTLAGPTGCATYDELRAAIKAESALSQ